MMLNKEELAIAYKNFDNDKIIKLAKYESKVLRAEAIPILEEEITKRNLDNTLLDWIKMERNFFEGTELQSLKTQINDSKCANCEKNKRKIGFNFSYLSMFNTSFNAKLILCEDCRKIFHKKEFLKSLTLGWISVYSIFSIPIYLLGELYFNLKSEKVSNLIIEKFIFENTGLIREMGIENIGELIHKHFKFKKHDK